MFKRFNVAIISNPACTKSLSEIKPDNFKYYDKDGFELNCAEQSYYELMGYPINHNILNHRCWQEPWFELEKKNSNLILDHSMILHRCEYSGAALEQLNKIKKSIPEADYLAKTKSKWGFDFALDAIDEEKNLFEVIHIEYDHNDYEQFVTRMISFEYSVRHIDWVDAAKKISKEKDKWIHLKGFAQNDWKANYILGWKKAEYTEKSLTF